MIYKSLITIIGTKLAAKQPDKKHPYGHGRVEYLSATVIAVIVLYAGISALVESVKKILSPETPDYSVISLVIIAVAVVVKILLGSHVRRVGTQVDSDSLVASGKDAMFDSVISASTLVAAVLYLTIGIKLEAWLGAVISLIIIKSGVEMLRDTISEILGERLSAEEAHAIKEAVNSFPEVRGAYDLVVHDYGPNRQIGSVHIEVADTMTASELDRLQREISQKVYLETGVVLTGISVYSLNTQSDSAAALRDRIRALLDNHPEVLQMHGFYLEEDTKSLRFDIVLDYDTRDMQSLYEQILQEVRAMVPDYDVLITLDYDISD